MKKYSIKQKNKNKNKKTRHHNKNKNKKTRNYNKNQNTRQHNKKESKHIIKNNTPYPIQLLSKSIEHEIKDGKQASISIKSASPSYSPEINKALVSMTKTDAKDIIICGKDFLSINIGSEKTPKCVKYDDTLAKELFLKNLKNPKIDCVSIIPPKQFLSNCWFNTLFISFFISDKGRKFFKFFRQLMIEGKDANGTKIPTELAKAFFIFNLAIEASQNHLLKKVAYLLNTNLLIKKIHDAIDKHYSSGRKNSINISSKITDIGDAGNPIDYYETIMSYLNNDALNIKSISAKKSANTSFIKSALKLQSNNIPDIIILEIYDEGNDGSGYSGLIKDKKDRLVFYDKNDKNDKNKMEYVLDSVIIRDTSGEHFSSLLTCNGDEYAYDGASYNRMTKFAWKRLLNKNDKWGFEGHNLKWNFMNAYQILFYYRV